MSRTPFRRDDAPVLHLDAAARSARTRVWWFAAPLLSATFLVAACAAANPTWTYDPSIGVATAAPAGSGAGSEVAAASPSSAPSAVESSAASAGASGPAASGGSISLTAQNVAFDTKTLTATAGQPFTVAFDNKDAGIPHNFAIYTDKSASNNLFRGDTVNGPGTTTYSVPALPAGTYYFQCDVHPSVMNGTITIK